MQTIILADGAFPKNDKLLSILRGADRIICCDGAAEKLLDFGCEPDAIVGDMDSLSDELKRRFRDRIYPSSDQETNDLTKAVEYCLMQNYRQIAILGATGLREDHTLGNISLLADYSLRIEDICLFTDYGRMDAARASKNFESRPGQQVSIFSLIPDTNITAHGLLYPIDNRALTSWWQGTLNEATADNFRLEFDKGCLLVYRLW
ncbi:MAG: thiamine diphosphokinase [Bacteroidales bacterium]|nr:thiamine diphosphokinase [Bacteroidales bacterium]